MSNFPTIVVRCLQHARERSPAYKLNIVGRLGTAPAATSLRTRNQTGSRQTAHGRQEESRMNNHVSAVYDDDDGEIDNVYCKIL